MANIPTEILNSLAPVFKEWAKEVFCDLIPALNEIHSPTPSTDKTPEYLSPEDVCTLLNISIPTLRKYTRAGVYTAYRVGSRKINYRRSEIDHILQMRRVDYLAKTRLSSPNKKGDN